MPVHELLDSSGRLRLNPEIENGDYFSVSLKAGRLTLLARGMVGYIPLNDQIMVYVRPRVPVSNLSHVIQVAGHRPTVLSVVREYTTGGEWNESLLDLYAGALANHIDEILSLGFYREYVRREEDSSFPRGRVLQHRTAQRLRSRGIGHRVTATSYERSPDNPPNRTLKYATWLLATRYKTLIQRALHRRLCASFSAFDRVALDHTRSFLEEGQVLGGQSMPAVRWYYRDALAVALAIIRQQPILVESLWGSIRMPSIVVNMNVVFEAYLRNVLDLHARSNGWPNSVLDGNTDGAKPLFSTPGSPKATPDVVIRNRRGFTPMVLEIKNVPVQGVFSKRDAIEQAVTYAVSFRSDSVVLVHPRASEDQIGGMHFLGTIGGVAVYQYRFDLGADDLAKEESRFGNSIGAALE